MRLVMGGCGRAHDGRHRSVPPVRLQVVALSLGVLDVVVKNASGMTLQVLATSDVWPLLPKLASSTTVGEDLRLPAADLVQVLGLVFEAIPSAPFAGEYARLQAAGVRFPAVDTAAVTNLKPKARPLAGGPSPSGPAPHAGGHGGSVSPIAGSFGHPQGGTVPAAGLYPGMGGHDAHAASLGMGGGLDGGVGLGSGGGPPPAAAVAAGASPYGGRAHGLHGHSATGGHAPAPASTPHAADEVAAVEAMTAAFDRLRENLRSVRQTVARVARALVAGSDAHPTNAPFLDAVDMLQQCVPRLGELVEAGVAGVIQDEALFDEFLSVNEGVARVLEFANPIAKLAEVASMDGGGRRTVDAQAAIARFTPQAYSQVADLVDFDAGGAPVAARSEAPHSSTPAPGPAAAASTPSPASGTAHPTIISAGGGDDLLGLFSAPAPAAPPAPVAAIAAAAVSSTAARPTDPFDTLGAPPPSTAAPGVAPAPRRATATDPLFDTLPPVPAAATAAAALDDPFAPQPAAPAAGGAVAHASLLNDLDALLALPAPAPAPAPAPTHA